MRKTCIPKKSCLGLSWRNSKTDVFFLEFLVNAVSINQYKYLDI